MSLDRNANIEQARDLFIGGGAVAARMRELDWARTPLGPPEHWPQSLRSIVRTLLTSRYQMWMGWGEQLTFFYNDAYAPTLGVKHPSALGQATSSVWREIWADVEPLIRQVLTTGEATYNEGMLLFLERSGFREETYHTFSYSPLFDDAGSIAGLFCVVVEETDRVIDARRLSALRALASAAADTTQQSELFRRLSVELQNNLRDLPFTVLYLFDADGRARRVASSGIEGGHAAAPAHIEAGEDSWSAKAIRQGAPATVVEDLQQRFESLPCGDWDQPPREALIVPISQQGAALPAGFLVAGINPYRRIDTAYRDFVGLIANQIGSALANARGFEQERQRAEALAALDHAKTTFFSNVSHEFRTPLTLLLGPLEELLHTQTKLPDAVRAQAEVAHRNGNRLLRLVNSLLDFSSIEAGRIRAKFESTDLAAFTAEIAASFKAVIERAGLRFEIHTQPLEEPIYLDRDMWEQIVLNLVSNAFKFTLHGGIQVSVGVAPDARHAQVKVVDSGIGIPEEELPKLFERFHRVEGARGRSIEGTGIGLALVHELVQLHGGRFEVSSEVGRGTTFTLLMPMGSAHLPPEQIRDARADATPAKANAFIEEASRWIPAVPGAKADATERSATGSIAPEDFHRRLGTGKRVLVADDNADMRDYLTHLLIGEGYAVDAVEDGDAALRAAQSAGYDLIVSDVTMPKLDGFALLHAIRSNEALASTPVIVLSARAGEEARVEGIEAGADDYLTKPFAAREFLARVSTNIQMAAVRRDAALAITRKEQQRLLSEDRLSRALATSRVAVYEWNTESDTLNVYGRLSEAFGVTMQQAAQGLPLAKFLEGIHPGDRERAAALVQRTLLTGEPFEVEYRLTGLGNERTVFSRGQIELLPNGERSFSGVLIDLTAERESERRLREHARALQILNRAASAIAGETRTESVVQNIVDAGVELIGAQFGAFFYNVQDERGERYTLYTLSGAPPEAFSSFPMPRNTQVFAPTFRGESIVRSADITQDPRYGKNSPRKGMPPGHLPVRSYLAVPVRSVGGEILGGLFFGHEKPAIFGERAEELIAGLAATAAVAMDNARLIRDVQRELTQRRAAEAELQALNATLEQRVHEEVAERVRAEDALRQAQKMEAVGQLTGGVAHDFNNLLTVIIGGLDTIRRAKPSDEARIKRAVEMALLGAQRASHLTSRLLAFSRRQPLDPKPLDLNIMVRDMTELLHRTLGEVIELEGVLAPRLWIAEVDQNQLESALINLAVNARDAMPEGGKLTIETANTLLDESYKQTDTEVIPGQYVMVAVSDTGLGMSADTLGRAFEPFFTTKDVGKGTGLGLSMVYGFVKQSGGHVTIYSEPGHGTTVKLYFPRYLGNASQEKTQRSAEAPTASGAETILVVEDNDDVRAYSVLVLNELGYRVLEAREAQSALEILESDTAINLLFTDVILPGKSGKVLADLARVRRPDLRVLYTTGYSRNAIVHHGRLDAGVQLIGKPFTQQELAQRVRDILDSAE